MTVPKKKLQFEAEVLHILSGLQLEQQNGHFIGRLTCGHLERPLYVKVDQALRALGGKWNRKAGGHLFTDDPHPTLTGLLQSGSLIVVKEGWFPTPEPVVRRMIDLARLEPEQVILEPSAGEGAIADLVHTLGGVPKPQIACVELNVARAGKLRQKGYPVLELDFMAVTTDHLGGQRFDRVLMNPPFENLQDIDHVRHAYRLLKSGGILVAVMSPGPFFRQDRKAGEFRVFLEQIAGYREQLPPDTFTIFPETIVAPLILHLMYEAVCEQPEPGTVEWV